MNKKNTHKFKFSIVTAVYNVENYLTEAIESIIKQTIGFQDSVEMILVDDGSTDSSGSICDTYQKKYPNNIKVIHKKNGGASSARNAGISIANGQYVNFMDSDDKLSPTALSAVYNFFERNKQEIDLISIPIYFFEGKTIPHRLNYKYASGQDQIIDLNTQYSYIQMSAASSFFKREVLTQDFFDTTLPYAEDAKAIMKLFLKNNHYGIVPGGSYYYRYRNSQNSALNGSKLHKEWYLNCLKDYILWAAETATKELGSVPDFVQYSIMYDLQSRFRMEFLPEDVLSENEKNDFFALLKEALSYIDNRIIMEQKHLSKEQKDYIIGIKNDNKEAVYRYSNEDGYIQYGDFSTFPLSSYVIKLNKLERVKNNIHICGSAKLNEKFPYPSEIYVRITSDDTVSKVPCEFEQNPERKFCSMGKLLAQFTDFQAVFPRNMIGSNTKLELCMTCDSHPILFRNLTAESTFPIPPGKKQTYLMKKRLLLKKERQALTIEHISIKKYLLLKCRSLKKHCIRSFNS